MLAVVNFARILIMQQASVWVAATVSFSMIITVILAKVIEGHSHLGKEDRSGSGHNGRATYYHHSRRPGPHGLFFHSILILGI